MAPGDRRDFLRALPLADLHRHFDGSIRPATLWELSERFYSAVPGLDFEAFRRYLEWDESQDRTLLDYLDKFHVPLQYTQFYENIKRIAGEIAEDAYRDGVRLLELRINPLIHRRAGLTTRQVIHATRKGLSQFGDQHPDFRAGIVIIAMRSHGGNMARILLREVIGEKEDYHAGVGVVGFDIAGPEAPFCSSPTLTRWPRAWDCARQCTPVRARDRSGSGRRSRTSVPTVSGTARARGRTRS
jgi:adenosine deaminase